MRRISKAEITGLSGCLLKRFRSRADRRGDHVRGAASPARASPAPPLSAHPLSRRLLGHVAEPAEVMWHNRPVLTASMAFGRKAQKRDPLDPNLKSFANMAVAATVGCSWCLDFGYFQAHNEGLDEAKASEVPRWRESSVFTSLERDVMDYAGAMTDTPPSVTDELFARHLKRLGDPVMVELTAIVALENMATRSIRRWGSSPRASPRRARSRWRDRRPRTRPRHEGEAQEPRCDCGSPRPLTACRERPVSWGAPVANDAGPCVLEEKC